MRNGNLLTKSWTVRDDNSNDIRVSETEDRSFIVISIMQADNGGRINTVTLNYDQFEAFKSLFDRYGSDRPECNMPEPEPDQVQQQKEAKE
jgi:hypothetical protein